MATVPVTDHVKGRLEKLKESEEHTSYDSLLRGMLSDYEDD